jgi:hypothetical protein
MPPPFPSSRANKLSFLGYLSMPDRYIAAMPQNAAGDSGFLCICTAIALFAEYR